MKLFSEYDKLTLSFLFFALSGWLDELPTGDAEFFPRQ